MVKSFFLEDSGTLDDLLKSGIREKARSVLDTE
jgi:hypothetical protein